MRFILGDITKLEITTIFPEAKRHDQKIKGDVLFVGGSQICFGTLLHHLNAETTCPNVNHSKIQINFIYWGCFNSPKSLEMKDYTIARVTNKSFTSSIAMQTLIQLE